MSCFKSLLFIIIHWSKCFLLYRQHVVGYWTSLPGWSNTKNVKIWQPLNFFFNIQPTLHIFPLQGLPPWQVPCGAGFFELMHVTEGVAIRDTFDSLLGFISGDYARKNRIGFEQITFGSQKLPWVSFTFIGPRDLFIAESFLTITMGRQNTHICWLMLNRKHLPFILISIVSVLCHHTSVYANIESSSGQTLRLLPFI